MANENTFYPVNWLDGMKIRKEHFFDEENAFFAQLIKSAQNTLNPYNYGLLPATLSIAEKNDITIDTENTGAVYVSVLSCRAITPDGRFIDIRQENGQPLVFNLPIPDDKQAGYYYISLSVDPFTREPFGQPDPDEEPPRYPYSKPVYHAHLISENSVRSAAGSNQYFIVGKIVRKDERFVTDDSYIPASSTVFAHKALAEAHVQFTHRLTQLEHVLMVIIQKIWTKEQQYVLAKLIKSLSYDLLQYISSQLSAFRLTVPNKPPVDMLTVLSGLGRVLKNTIDARQGSGKEELINYFNEWCDLNQAQFEQVVADVVHHEYRHIEIRKAVNVADDFTRIILDLFTKLSGLDYIGRRSEKDIFVKEEELKSSESPRSGFSFFKNK